MSDFRGEAYALGEHIIIEWWSDNTALWQRVLDVVRSLPDREFKKKHKHWTVPLQPFHASRVVEKLKPFDFYVADKIVSLADSLSTIAEKAERTESPSARVIKAYNDNRLQLYPYQVAAVDFLNSVDGRAIVGDDVGLGKTIESLAWAWTNKVRRTIAVVPANVVYKWEEDVKKWTGWTPQVLDTSKELPDLNSPFHIMSYDIMRRQIAELADIQYGLLILDEFHYIKNNRAQRTRAAKLLAKGIPHILGLSGTPMLNRPIELFNILHILDKEAWPNWFRFGNRYAGGVTHKGRFVSSSNEEELAERLKTIMIRRLKEEVLDELPDLTRVQLPVEVDLTEYSKVAHNVREAILTMNPESKGYWINVLDRLNMLRRAIGRAKMKPAFEWSDDFLRSGRKESKLVIFAHHKDVVNYLKKKLARYGCTTIVGDTPQKERQKRANAFQSEPAPRVIIISSAGREGIDLYGKNGLDCSNILIAELPWRPADITQAEGRLHRVGQKNAVTSWILQARGTVDTFIANRLEVKDERIKKTVGGSDVTTIVRDLVASWREM